MKLYKKKLSEFYFIIDRTPNIDKYYISQEEILREKEYYFSKKRKI